MKKLILAINNLPMPLRMVWIPDPPGISRPIFNQLSNLNLVNVSAVSYDLPELGRA
jgi:hypothetical protein